MATPNIVPRSDSEGGLGTASKYWAAAYIDTITTTSHINLPDNAILKLGTGSDLSISHDATNSHISNSTGDLKITQNANDKDIVFYCDDGAGGTATYFYLDGSSATHDGSATTALYTNWPDKSRISLGTSHDIYMYHDGSNTWFENQTGDLTFRNSANDKDIIFQSDDGNGGNATYFFLDGSANTGGVPRTVFPDNSNLVFGTGNDLFIRHNTANSEINNFTGDLIFTNNADDKDIIFQSDDGSGGVTEYFRLDGSAVRNVFLKETLYPDNVKARFGSGGDLEIFHDGSDSFIKDAGTGNLKVMANNLYLQNASGENYINCYSDDRVEIFHNNSKKLETTSTGIISYNKVVIKQSDIGGGEGVGLQLINAAGNQLWNVTCGVTNVDNATFNIRNSTTNVDVFKLATNNDATFAGHVNLADSKKLQLGASQDLQIYHDGSNSYIQDTGTGDLYIDAATNFFVRNKANGEVWIKGTDSGVSLRYQDSQRLITTATGISVTGATGTTEGGGIDASDAVSISVGEINGEIITTIFVDIGVGSILSSGTAGDVIGNDGVAAAFITKVTTAINGLVYRGEMICLEVPTTGDPDINLSANASGTIAEDAAGEGEHVLINGGTATLAAKNDITVPSGGIQEDFLYLTHGGTTAGTYDAGKFLIKLYGAKVTGI